MAKIPFDIKHRPQIESGEYKVETKDYHHVRIICWNKNTGGLDRIVALVAGDSGQEKTLHYTKEGLCVATGNNRNKDLFIVTPEEELTEFEKACMKLYNEGCDDGLSGDKLSNESVKEWASELLALARDQFIKDGYVIEKKAFYDAVENISDKHRAEMSVEYSIHCKIENGTRHAIMNWEAFQKVAQKFIDIGKAEALKDLPRWKKATGKERFNERVIVLAGDNDLYCTNYVEEGEYYLSFHNLERLPGFKENESHE